MARDSKTEVAAINLRIPSDANRDYVGLIILLASLRRGVRVHGDTFVAIQSFNEATRIGTFSKYTEIDIGGDWFNLEKFSPASAEDKSSINIPDKLRPNHAAFYFKINNDLHTLAFELYSDSKGLSTRSVEQYFKYSLKWKEISSQFGDVQADIIKSYDEAESLLSLPKLKEIRFTIKRPNPDDIDNGLANFIEGILHEQNADEYEEVIKSRDKDSILPNDRSFKLAKVASENGKFSVKNLENGVLTTHSTDEIPLKEVVKHKSDESALNIFVRMAGDIFEKVRSARAQVRG